jgi:hypothetical protein
MHLRSFRFAEMFFRKPAATILKIKTEKPRGNREMATEEKYVPCHKKEAMDLSVYGLA